MAHINFVVVLLLSGHQLSEHSIIQTVEMTVLLGYFDYSVHSIRVFERGSVHKLMGFHYPNFSITELTQGQMSSDNGKSTVPRFHCV